MKKANFSNLLNCFSGVILDSYSVNSISTYCEDSFDMLRSQGCIVTLQEKIDAFNFFLFVLFVEEKITIKEYASSENPYQALMVF
jgi:hypothetical protein